jgi:hypothetical protein
LRTAEVWAAFGCSNFEEGPTNVGGVLEVTKFTHTLSMDCIWDAVTPRWAREHANEVGALDGTKKSDIYKYIADFIYFSSNSL